jgi:hypothetical protein
VRRAATALAYHGCDQSVGEDIILGKIDIRPSVNDYDWLGSGAYFWEDSVHRALDWAEFMAGPRSPSRNRIKKPFVIGAIIDPGDCLDLSNPNGLSILKEAYPFFEAVMQASRVTMPQNQATHQGDLDLVKRFLDCAVINFLHSLREVTGKTPFDTIRCPFMEGGDLFEGSKIQARTHIQWCVRDPKKSVIGYFIPRFHPSREEEEPAS